MEINKYKIKLETLKEAGNFRSLPESDKRLVDLSSNDYLRINHNKLLYEEFKEEIVRKGFDFSSCSSRLLSGNSKEYTELENLISSAYNREACLIYNSGYHANTGVLPTLAEKKDLILADKLVHSSLIDGIKLSNATSMRYRHLDYNHLQNLLNKYRSEYENVFIVSESIFSMDGDIANLEKLVEIKEKYKCYLYIDEAHAAGAIGNKGLGCVEESGLINEIDFIVGTFGKAIASLGAYVVSSEIFKHYLINHSRTLIYTTALPPINLAWTKFVFERLPDMNTERKHLKTLSEDFAQNLGVKHYSHIIPFLIGSNHESVKAANDLKNNGFNVLPIRHPTVPEGTARLRFSLNSGLNVNQLIPIKNIVTKYEKNLVE